MTIEVPALAAGVLPEIRVKTGDTVVVGAPALDRWRAVPRTVPKRSRRRPRPRPPLSVGASRRREADT
ncbi:MAG: hypothetical protein U1E87_07970 [Alphaproteobacteria bacterium]